jgi:hypothetical protein
MADEVTLQGLGGAVKHVLGATDAPSSSDDERRGFRVGSMWVVASGLAYVCVRADVGEAEWVAGGDVDLGSVTDVLAAAAGNGNLVGISAGGAIEGVSPSSVGPHAACKILFTDQVINGKGFVSYTRNGTAWHSLELEEPLPPEERAVFFQPTRPGGVGSIEWCFVYEFVDPGDTDEERDGHIKFRMFDNEGAAISAANMELYVRVDRLVAGNTFAGSNIG